MNSPMKGRGGALHALAALRYSVRGLTGAWRRETAFRQEVLIGVPLLAAAPWLAPDRVALVLLIGAVLLVWFAELINTSLEALCDRISEEQHPLLGLAKDAASAAVMVSLILCALTWIILLGP